MSECFTMDQAPERRLPDRWRWVVSKSYYQVDIKNLDASSFQGKIRRAVVGNMDVTAYQSSRHGLSRTSRHIAADCDDHIVFVLQTRGAFEFCQRDRRGTVAAGSSVLLTSIEPYETMCTDGYENVSFQVPREMLASRVSNIEDLCARTLDLDSTTYWFLHDALHSLLDRQPSAEPCGIMEHKIAASLVDVCATAIQSNFGASAVHEGSEHSQNVRRRILTYILDRISDPALNLEVIASENGISVSYLHKLFKSSGCSVNRWIVLKRLEQCYEKLSNPLYDHQSISQIAFDSGFVNMSHFSTRFRDHFAVSPRELRSNANS